MNSPFRCLRAYQQTLHENINNINNINNSKSKTTIHYNKY